MLSVKSKFISYLRKKTVFNINITLNREDISDEQLVEIMQSVGSFGYFTFTPDKLKTEVEKIMKNKTIGIRNSGFSPSQVLRGKINILWEKSDSEKTFAEFYSDWMDKIINHFDGKIKKQKG